MEKKSYLLPAVGVYILVIILAYLFTGDMGLAGGITLSLLLGLGIYYYTINQTWEGSIIDFKDRIYYKQGDEATQYHDKRFIVQLKNGKTKKIYYNPAWKIGDKLAKVKGEYEVKKI